MIHFPDRLRLLEHAPAAGAVKRSLLDRAEDRCTLGPAEVGSTMQNPPRRSPHSASSLTQGYSSDHQRRRGRSQLPHPSDPSLRPRLPQPGALQDRHLLPLRRPPALPPNPRTSRMSRFFSRASSGARPASRAFCGGLDKLAVPGEHDRRPLRAASCQDPPLCPTMLTITCRPTAKARSSGSNVG